MIRERTLATTRFKRGFELMQPATDYRVSGLDSLGGGSVPPVAGRNDGSRKTGTGLQLLLVEDEAITALALKRLVARLGYGVCGVTATAEDAIRLAGEVLPDMILMDIRLAGERDGIWAAREIRTRFGIGSIFMTANNDPATRARAEGALPLGFMDKPYSPMTVKTALRTAAEHLGPMTRN